jgi:hypothetical protein
MGRATERYRDKRRKRIPTRRLVDCTGLRHSAWVTDRKLRTAEYSQEARTRLGAAVTAARVGAGYKFRPPFAKFAGVSLRSLVDLEQGKPGVGEANLLAVSAALPNWTEDTPRVILEGGPVPPIPTQETDSTPPRTPHEWSADERAQMGAMTMDEVLATYSELRKRSEYFALSWLDEATRVQREKTGHATPKFGG